MAKFPIEIIIVGEKGLADIPAAIALANQSKTSFCFHSTAGRCKL